MAKAQLQLVPVIGGIDESLLRKATEDYAEFVIGVKEGVWNEADAGGTQIFAQFLKRGSATDLHIWGNGVGVSDEGLHAIVRIMDSPSSKDPKKRGRIGTGSKAFCRHAAALTVQTLRHGESQILEIHYSTKELNAILHGRKTVNWTPKDIPAGGRLRGSGTCFIWHELGAGDPDYVNPKHQRTAARLIAELAAHLPREVAKMITIVDDRGKHHKVVPRKLVGQLLEITDTVPGIGAVSCEIAITDTIEPMDRLRLWGRDPGCTINSFLHHVRKTGAITPFLASISRVLDHPQVIGEIAIPGWQHFVLRATDAGFRQDLYDDEDSVFGLLSWLYERVVPQVEKYLGTQNEKQTTDADTLRDELVREYQLLGGKPEGEEEVVDLSSMDTQPARVVLECGESVWVEIEKPKDGGEYQWDDRGAPATVSPRRGARVRFTGLSTPGAGHVELKLGNRIRKIQVEVASRLVPSLAYATRRVTVGQRITHRVIHARHLKGAPRWSVQHGHGLLEIEAEGLSVVHQIPNTPGIYEVKLHGDLDDGTKLDLTATVLATEPGDDRPTRRKTTDAEFTYDGHCYVLALRNFPGEAARTASYVDVLTDGRTRINLNFGHPEFAGGDAQRKQMARFKIALHIAADEERRKPSLSGSSDRIIARASEIFAALAGKIAKKN